MVFREGNEIYGIIYGEHFLRQRKHKSRDAAEIKKIINGIEKKIDALKYDIRAAESRLKRTRVYSFYDASEQAAEIFTAQKHISESEKGRLEKELDEWRAFYKEVQDKAQYPQRKFRAKYKNIPKEKAVKKVTEYVLSEKEKGKTRVTAEEASVYCKIPKGQVTWAFHKLNLLGVLSQKERQFAHDTNRAPIFWGGESGWGANTYYIN